MVYINVIHSRKFKIYFIKNHEAITIVQKYRNSRILYFDYFNSPLLSYSNNVVLCKYIEDENKYEITIE